MPLYIMLTKTTGKTRQKLIDDPDLIQKASTKVSNVMNRIVNSYAVLGRYDYILLVEAENNQTVAQLSRELGVITNLSVETLPALQISELATHFESPIRDEIAAEEPIGTLIDEEENQWRL